MENLRCEDCIYFQEEFDPRVGTGYCEYHKQEVFSNSEICEDYDDQDYQEIKEMED
jgi:hypothetical protein